MRDKSSIKNRFKGDSGNLQYIKRHIDALKPGNANIRAVCRYLTRNHGKMLRPSLLFLLCREYKVKITPDIRLAALVLELIHNATLLQDDAFDNERIRRGKPSANVAFGDTRAILASDYLLIKAMELLRGMNNGKIETVIYKSAFIACSGEMDHCDMDDPDKINLKSYVSIIERKTASLFRVCGEIVNLHLPKKYDEIISFTKNFGLLYQIFDDLYDAESLMNGERTDYSLKDIVCLPVIYLLKTKDKRLFEKGGKIAPKKFLRLMSRQGAYHKSLRYVRKRFGASLKSLNRKNELLSLILEARYSEVERFLEERCKG